MIPYGRQNISAEDIAAVVNVLKSDFLTQGPKVPEFEETLKAYTGSQYAIALNSATSALHVACLALGLGDGDWLWTSPVTFVASANAGLYCGANVDFVDIDDLTYNMCANELEKKLVNAKAKGILPKIVMPVHLAGQSCDMKSIKRLSKKYGFKIIEDASHGIGGSYRGAKLGSCAYSDITVFSFHPVKIITTAEGGAALTNDFELAKKMDLYRTHGITRDPKNMKEQPHGPWYYQQLELGFNYRMTDLQAALGISQMSRLDEFVRARHNLASNYDKVLERLNVKSPFQVKGAYSAFHLYIIKLKLNLIQKSHKETFEGLRAKGIGVNLHYIPVHMHPFYRTLGFQFGDFPKAEKYYSEAISLPMHYDLSTKDQLKVVEALSALISKE